LEAIDNNDCDIAIATFNNIYETSVYETKISPVILPFDGIFDIKNYVCRFHILQNYSPFIGSIWNKIYLLDSLKKFNITFSEDLSLHEDSIFNFELYKHLQKIYIVNEPLYNYCHALNKKSLSKKLHDNIHYFTRLYFKSYKDLMKYYNVYSDENQLFLENSCYKAYIVCLLHSTEKQVTDIMNDEVFINTLPYINPKKIIYKLVYFSIKKKYVRLLIKLLYLINLKHKVFG